MPPLNAVLFDLDGTLMDTPLAIAQVLRQVLADRGHHDVPPEQVRALVGTHLPYLLADLLNTDHTSPEVLEAIADYRRLYELHVTPRAKELLYPGVLDGLNELHEEGLKLAVATNKIQAVAMAMLETAGVAQCFHMIAGSDMVPLPKPHPALGLLTAERLRVTPAECAMVGDTEHDVHMAQQAGMFSIALTHGAHEQARLQQAQPTVVLHTFTQAVAWVKARRRSA